MTAFVWANFYQTTLSAAVTSSQTAIQVASATGVPTIAAGQQWAIVVQSASTPSAREVMYATAITSTTFTVTRAQEGTAAGTWAIGDNVFGGNTAGQLGGMGQLAAAQTWTGENTFSGSVVVPNATPGDANPVPITQGDTRYAAINGSSSETFSVANATSSTEAVALGQFTQSLTGDGYVKLPGGLIIQWGEYTNSGSTFYTVDFNIAFPNASLNIVVTDSGSNCYPYGAQTGNVGTFLLLTSSTALHTCYWHAIGY